MSSGFVAVPIIPVFKGMSKEFAERLERPAKASGERAGKAMSQGLASGVKSLEGQVAASKRKLEDLDRAQERSYAKQEEKRHAVEAATLALAAAEEKYQKAVDAGKTGTDELARVARAKGALTKANHNLRDAEIEVTVAERKHKDQLDDLNRTMGKYQTAQREAEKATKKSGGAFSSLKSGLAEAGAGFDLMSSKIKTAMGLLGGAGLAGSFRATTKSGMEYESAMGTLNAVSGETAEAMAKAAERARELGNDVALPGTSAATATAAMVELAKGGMNVQEAMDAARGTIALAAAAQIDGGQAAEIQAAALNTFSLKADQAGRVADVLANSANASAAELTDIAQGMQQGGTVAAQFGLSLEDTAAALGMFANSGIQGSDAGTLLKTSLLALTDQGKPAQAAIKELGLTVYDSQGKFVGYSSLMGQLEKASKRMTDEQYQAATATLFGSDAMRMAGIAAKQGQAGFDNMRNAVERQGAALDVASAKMVGLPGAMEKFKNSLEEAGLSIYEHIKGPLTQIVEKGTEVVGFFSGIFNTLMEIPGAAELATGAILGTVGVLAGLGAAFVTATAGMAIFNTAKGIMTGLTVANSAALVANSAALEGTALAAAQATFGVKAMTTALLTSPLTWIAAAAVAAGVALWAFFTKTESGRKLWDQLVGGLKAGWEWVKGVFIAGWEKSIEVFGRVKASLEELFAAFQGDDFGVGALSSFFGEEAAKKIAGFFDAAGSKWEDFKSKLKSFSPGDLWAGFTDGLATLGEALEPVRQILADSLAGTFESLKSSGSALWEILKNLTSSLSGAFLSILQGVWGLLKGVWDLIGPLLIPALKIIGAVIGGLVIGAVIAFAKTLEALAWGLSKVLEAINWVVEKIGGPLISAIGLAAQWLGEKLGGVLSWVKDAAIAAFQWISDKWKWLTEAFSTGWGWLRDNVLNPVVGFFTGTLWPAIQKAIEWIADKWDWLKDMLVTAALWMFDNAIMPYVRGFQWLWEKATAVADWISEKWNWLSGKLQEGWAWVDSNVFQPIHSGLETLQGWYQAAVDGIGRTWDSLKAKTAAPINWVIDFAYNNGIRTVWDSVASLLGMEDKKLPEIQKIAFARGGITPGPATPGRDIHRYFSPTGGFLELSGREAVMRPEWTEAMGEDYVHAMNAAARSGGVAGVRKKMREAAAHYHTGGVVQRFANGGIIGSITGLLNRFFPNMSITSTLRNTADLHGQGKAVDASDGFDTTPGMQALARFFYENYGSGLAELIHWPLKGWQNIDEGRPFDFGEPTNSQHRNHVHIASHAALPAPEDAESWLAKIGESIKSGVGGAMNFARSKVASLIGSVLDPIEKAIPDFGPGLLGEIGKQSFGKIVGDFKAFIEGKAGAVKGAGSYDGAGGSSGNAESWRSMAMEAMRRQGFNADDPSQVSAMLAQIQSESGGNAGIAQQIVDVNGTGDVAGVGLLQIIPGTFAAHRDPTLPNDRRDPWANMNAALRYYRSRYGGDLTTMWGKGHGYAAGGVLPGFTPGRDVHRFFSPTAGALDLSGGEAIMVPEWTRAVGGPAAVAAMNVAARGGRASTPPTPGAFANGGVFTGGAAGFDTTQITKALEDLTKQLQAVADPKTVEGITARAVATEMGEIISSLGLEEIASVTNAVIGAEKELLDAREAHAARLSEIAEKSAALEEAQKALAEAQAASTEMSVQDKRKLEDAMRGVEEAKTPNKKGEVDADKVAKAEEKLSRVREDLAANGVKSEEKRASEVKKAADQVAKAEGELAQARMKSIRALDMPLHSLVPQISQLASAGAEAASRSGLGGVADALSTLAGVTGPAGMSVGMVIQTAKTGIRMVKSVVDVVKGFVEKIFAARHEARRVFAEGWEVIAKYAALVVEMQGNVSKLQQELVRGANAIRVAEFNLKSAINDRLVAEAEGILSVAQARMALDKELEKGAVSAHLRLMGLQEDWDTYREFESKVAQGALQAWSDGAISALFSYEAARAKALQAELKARVDQIKAEQALADAQRLHTRNQFDLLKAQERLIRMTAKVAGVDLEEATGTAQVAKLLAELAKVKSAADRNILGRWGAAMGANGTWANEYRGQRAQEAGLRDAVSAVLQETGVALDPSKMERVLSLMAQTQFRGGDVMAALRANLPELAAAETALKVSESLRPVFDARDAKLSADRALEDLRSEIDLFEKTHPLEETVKGLDHSVKSLDRASEAWASGNEKIRGDFLAASKASADAAAGHGVRWKLDERYAAAVQEKIQKEVTIHLSGREMYTAAEVDRLLAEVTAGSNVSAKTVISSTTVANSRRKELV
ncbi:phage tail tape measure protein [Corynebacterium ulcerans]|uniref:Phage-related minor tail protein n=1 Tax=Corynebacterium ulcerans FRC58 TaxID=1408268 RepID=A0ABN4GVA0_CORUL|nr:phage tail tape measure protein [Corynebacterium ulcerans]AKN77518.1 Phage-related minor tail protein [Corynebacterium ulcerans FRC58]